MPATVEKRGDRWRVVEPSGKLVTNKGGTPVDGGGHASRADAQKQAGAINSPKRPKRPKRTAHTGRRA